MRLLADENFPQPIVRKLLFHNHDVSTINTDTPGSDDWQVLRHATNERRILLTLDNDFEEIVDSGRMEVPFGVVLFRLPQYIPNRERIIVEKLESRSDWTGHFSFIDQTGIYMKSLPYVNRLRWI